jgi:very-short-patch-repair endonuclease
MQDRLTLSRQRLIQARAHGLRSSMRASERSLWSCLRGRQLGVQFRRQVPLLNRFIVDFFAPAARVAVEVDGGYHGRRVKADARRDEALRRAGYRVLRLEAEVVSKDLTRAVALVRQAVTASGAG